jgi:hypothetical protein
MNITACYCIVNETKQAFMAKSAEKMIDKVDFFPYI